MTYIGPFDGNHTRIVANFPGELPITHIDCIYAFSAVLQKTIGKTAGGCADVDADGVLRR